MKKKFFKRVLSGLTGTVLTLSALPSLTTSAYQRTGTTDGYDWEEWSENDDGTHSMTVGSNGTYTCEWNNIKNTLFRSGKKWSNNPQWDSLNGIVLDYEVDYQPNGNSYLCVYGWMTEPTIEYYICENYGTWRPPGNQFTLKGTKVIDGGTYEIYEGTHTGPSIFSSNETFNQYWSIRVDGQLRSKGTIDVGAHFAAWEEYGIKLGGLHEVALNVEGYMSSGKATVLKNELTIGQGGSEQVPIEPVEPDENGYYFHSTFESGTDNWKGRGSASVTTSNGALSVTGREDSWNGAAINLDTNAFEPGKSYGFSVNAMQDATASEEFKLTLQCTVNGEDQYLNVATATGNKGEWVTLSNPSFEIPSGATGLILYVETSDSTTSFKIDEAIGAVENMIPTPITEDPYIIGDLNDDGKIDGIDVALEKAAFKGTFAGKPTSKAADINSDGSVTLEDIQLLEDFVLGKIKSFPKAEKTTTTTSKNNQNTTTTTTTKSNGGSSVSYMSQVSQSISASVPSNILSNNNMTTQKISYFSKKANKNKNAVVILPDGYSTSKKYPVVYVNHGIMGSENDMVGYCTSIGGSLMKSGEAVPMIMVSTAMYTNPDKDTCSGITADETKYYDDFREDLIDSLMPYIEQNYSVATGRENTAICGFSMGGRESLYIGITRPEYFGYIGAASPAPGIVPAQDMFMTHPGNMQPSEFKVQNSAYNPYFLMITGGTNDNVVGTFPRDYHNILSDNGQEHIWQEIQGGGHDQSCINPLMYNFLKNCFKAN